MKKPEYRVGDLVRIGYSPLAHRILTVGDEDRPDVAWIWESGQMRQVSIIALDKIADIRTNLVACALNEWPRFEREVKIKRIQAAIMAGRKLGWRSDFEYKITHNLAIFDAVVSEVYTLMANGVSRWAMRPILEYIRRQTALADSASEFKINNNMQGDLARLVLTLFPETDGFFQIRSNVRRELAA